MFSPQTLSGKVALVTGGGTGIGRAIAIDLARAGADVAVTGRTLQTLQETAAEITALGRRAVALAADATNKAEVDAMAHAVTAELGRIDVLVNCAGGSAREKSSVFALSTEEVWDEVIARNYKSVLNATRAVLDQMIDRKKGRIINVASLDGMIGAAGRADYSGAKAAVIGFSLALSKEVARHGITVNCISPGPIVSGYDEIMLTNDSEEGRKWAKQMTEVTGFGYGQKADVSTMTVFLASDESGFISGQNYPVCGLANINLGW